jgi:hypothetical protein
MGNVQKSYCNIKEEEKEAEELGIVMNYKIYQYHKQCICMCWYSDIFTMYGINNMKMYLQECFLSFSAQYVPVLLSIMLIEPTEGKITV